MTEEVEVHYIFYEEYHTKENRLRMSWECQTCSSAGSGPEGYDVEAHAEKSHAQVGITRLSTTNKRRGE